MLGENVNKSIFVVWAGAIVASLFGVSMVMFPSAMDKVGDTIKESTNKFINPSATKSLSLDVEIPNYESSNGSFYLYNEPNDNGDGTWTSYNSNPWKNPIFAPNEYDESYPYMGGGDEWSRTFNYTNGLQSWIDNLKNSDSLKENNGGSVPTDALVSPFTATDSKGNDINKNIRFKSLKITKLDTVKNTTVSTDTADVTVNNKTVKGIQFNHEYSDYGELLDAIYIYAGNNGVEYDGNYMKYYVQKAYFTATYTVTDSDGNSTTQSSSFTVTDKPYYMNPDVN